MVHLGVADVGNLNLRYKAGREYRIEPSLVAAVDGGGFSFSDTDAPRAFVYERGPAFERKRGRPAPEFYVGEDARRAGTNNISVVGTANARVSSAAYLLLHFYTLVRCLPPRVREADVNFAGGLPAGDYRAPGVLETLKAKLRGTHFLSYGGDPYQITVKGSLFLPQPAAVAASFLFTERGQIRTGREAEKKRLILDIGGGTTDCSGREGLDLIPGTEDGFKLGFVDAADRARQLIVKAHPSLLNLETTTVVEACRQRTYKIRGKGGSILDIRPFVDMATEELAPAIIARLPGSWEAHMEDSELVIAGGGGEDFYRAIKAALGDRGDDAVLHARPVFAVLEGIDRFAQFKLKSAS